MLCCLFVACVLRVWQEPVWCCATLSSECCVYMYQSICRVVEYVAMGFLHTGQHFKNIVGKLMWYVVCCRGSITLQAIRARMRRVCAAKSVKKAVGFMFRLWGVPLCLSRAT